MKTFKGRVAVITGGASGLGREFARHAAALGMRIVLADVEREVLADALDEFTAMGASVIGHLCDVRKAEQVQALAEATIAKFGTVHLVFNNAGVATGGLLWESTEADWEWVLGVNMWGVIHGTRIFTRLMLECAKDEADYEGHIVNTASMAGLFNTPATGVYNVSKHAVVALSETLYHDLQLVGAPIGASVLCPHFVPTAINQSHRNRPSELKSSARLTASQRASQALNDKAVESGTVTAEQVAELTFRAIEEGRFYIYSHPGALAGAQQRMEDLVAARNPSDPHLAEPHVREALQSFLKSNAA